MRSSRLTVTERPSATRIQSELAERADPERAANLQRFFKTGPGEYGEGDRFLGITVPEQRRVARRNRAASDATCERLLASPWHEHRLVGLLILRERFERGDAGEREAIAELYLANRERVDNWDLVDASARYLLFDRVRAEPRELLDPLVGAEVVWDRRIGVLATFSLIADGEFDETLRVAEALLGDPHDLIHKAVGWMLREIGKRDERPLREFLDRHAAAMPRTMLRYSLERLDPQSRARYMQAGRP